MSFLFDMFGVRFCDVLAGKCKRCRVAVVGEGCWSCRDLVAVKQYCDDFCKYRKKCECEVSECYI